MATIPLAAAARSRPRRRMRYPAAYLALLPAAIIVVVAYLGCMLWTARLSFTSSKLLPKLDFVGLAQYQRLFENERFIVSIENIVVFGVLYLDRRAGPRASCWPCSSTSASAARRRSAPSSCSPTR